MANQVRILRSGRSLGSLNDITDTVRRPKGPQHFIAQVDTNGVEVRGGAANVVLFDRQYIQRLIDEINRVLEVFCGVRIIDRSDDMTTEEWEEQSGLGLRFFRIPYGHHVRAVHRLLVQGGEKLNTAPAFYHRSGHLLVTTCGRDANCDYGVLGTGNNYLFAHQFVAGVIFGPRAMIDASATPDGVRGGSAVSHLCHVKGCLNPDHIVIEQIADNHLRQGCADRRVCNMNHHPPCIFSFEDPDVSSIEAGYISSGNMTVQQRIDDIRARMGPPPSRLELLETQAGNISARLCIGVRQLGVAEFKRLYQELGDVTDQIIEAADLDVDNGPDPLDDDDGPDPLDDDDGPDPMDLDQTLVDDGPDPMELDQTLVEGEADPMEQLDGDTDSSMDDTDPSQDSNFTIASSSSSGYRPTSASDSD